MTYIIIVFADKSETSMIIIYDDAAWLAGGNDRRMRLSFRPDGENINTTENRDNRQNHYSGAFPRRTKTILCCHVNKTAVFGRAGMSELL